MKMFLLLVHSTHMVFYAVREASNSGQTVGGKSAKLCNTLYNAKYHHLISIYMGNKHYGSCVSIQRFSPRGLVLIIFWMKKNLSVNLFRLLRCIYIKKGQSSKVRRVESQWCHSHLGQNPIETNWSLCIRDWYSLSTVNHTSQSWASVGSCMWKRADLLRVFFWEYFAAL